MQILILSTLVLPDVVTKIKQPSDKNYISTTFFVLKKPKENSRFQKRHKNAIFSKKKRISNSYPWGDCAPPQWGHFDTSPDLLAPSQLSRGAVKNRDSQQQRSIKNLRSDFKNQLCEEAAHLRGSYPWGDRAAQLEEHFKPIRVPLASSGAALHPSTSFTTAINNNSFIKILCARKFVRFWRGVCPGFTCARAFPPPPHRPAKIGAKLLVNPMPTSPKLRNFRQAPTANECDNRPHLLTALS